MVAATRCAGPWVAHPPTAAGADMKTRTALALVTVALPVAAVAPASASGGGGDVRTHGGCSGPAVWKLKAKPDDGRIEVEAEVDSNRAGQAWGWVLKHNGSV